jgi:predicted DNA-binding transcriptional regulator YafY
MSKISHLLEMIITLQYKGLTTASELAETLQVDKKTIYRYINSLNKANIPVHTKKGRYGGFYIDEEFYMKPSPLSEEELQALLIAAQILTQENGFLQEKDLKSAIAKVKGLCVDDNEELRYLNYNGDFKISEIGNSQNLGNKILKVNHAMNKGRSLNINYFSINKNNLSVRTIDPYNLIFREGAWHIIGYCHMKNEVQAFKLTRIESINITDKIYMTPRTFSLKEYLSDNWGVFKGDKIRVSIRFSGELEELINNTKWHTTQEIKLEDNNFIKFTVYLDETEEIKKWIMGFGRRAEVIEPQELREEIKEEIQDMLKKY